MPTKITSKGQVTIPKRIRQRLGVKAGDAVDFVEQHGEVLVRRHVQPEEIEKWRGYLQNLRGQDVDERIRKMRDE
jgi:antitoxin PrlF